MPWLPGARVLDLFAGAGGVGLEALSRGAAHATLVERDARAVAALRANVATLGVEKAARAVRDEVARALSALARAGERFDVVFLDPPYDTDDDATTIDELAGDDLTAGCPPCGSGGRSRRSGCTRPCVSCGPTRTTRPCRMPPSGRCGSSRCACAGWRRRRGPACMTRASPKRTWIIPSACR